jgi:BASS family bile acid:Na+ symporter
VPLARRAAVATTASAAAAAPSEGAVAAVVQAAVNMFPVFVLGAAVLGAFQPTSFDWFLPSYTAPALGVTMLGMGLTLTFEASQPPPCRCVPAPCPPPSPHVMLAPSPAHPHLSPCSPPTHPPTQDFRRVLRAPGRILAGFALQYTVMPALAFALSRLAGLPLDYAIGLCVVGSCPGGTASNVVTYLARADVPLSVAMTTASTLGAVVATPLLTALLLGTLVPVSAAALLASTLQVVLLAVLAGAALNSAFPGAVRRAAPAAALSAVLLIATICGSVIAQNAGAARAAGPRLLAAVAALHAGGFALGYAASKGLGAPETTARTTSIEVGMQNSALGAVLASLHFPAHPLAAVPCALSACTHSVMGSLLAAFWRARPAEEAEAGGAAAPAPAPVPAPVPVAAEPDAATRRAEVRGWIAGWRERTGAPGAPSKYVTAEEAATFSAQQLEFLERKRREAEERASGSA